MKMTKIISLITLLLFSIATHADDFDILGTWYQYEADQVDIDGIWVFNANYVLRWVRQPTDGTGIIGNWMDKKSSGITYNLSGQQLTTPRKGINIINGKKVVIK